MLGYSHIFYDLTTRGPSVYILVNKLFKKIVCLGVCIQLCGLLFDYQLQLQLPPRKNI